jgi:catechol 2,3-dioxygenase-like lactoylglutathione lyase family enzyme
VLGHLGVNVPDLRAAKRYYDAAMPLLGFTQFLDAADEFAYCPAGGKPGTYVFFYPAVETADHHPYSRHRVGLQHLAFMMPSRSAVDAVHRHVVAITRRSGSTPGVSCWRRSAITTGHDAEHYVAVRGRWNPESTVTSVVDR